MIGRRTAATTPAACRPPRGCGDASVAAARRSHFEMAQRYGSHMPGLHRILVLGGGLPAYFEASEQEKREVFLPRFRSLLAEWEELGAQVVASFCDDVLQVGPVTPTSWAWYLIFDVESLDTAAKMIE